MKKVNKRKILATKLSSFGIKLLTNWIKRQERKADQGMKYWESRCENPSTDDRQDNPEQRLEQYKKVMSELPTTVGKLIVQYPYRFTEKWYVDNQEVRVGLGKNVIAELKQKLVDLGLTPDDWPALVRHDELLTHLSKRAILKLPVTEIIQKMSGWISLTHYFGYTEEELKGKTMKDFLDINPTAYDAADQESKDLSHDRSQFLERKKHHLVAIRQQLVAKGFTTRDGAFFKWNPEQKSLAKAMERLRKYDLSSADEMRFARIVVAERWVI